MPKKKRRSRREVKEVVGLHDVQFFCTLDKTIDYWIK